MAPRKQKDNVETEQQLPNAVLEAALVENKEDHYNYGENIAYKVSSGSLQLDIATKKFGPSVIRLVGQNNEGKTPEGLEIMRNFLSTVENSYGFIVRAEARLSEENMKRCGLKFTEKSTEWTPGTVFVLRTSIYECVIKTLRSLMRNNPTSAKYCFMIDSIDGLMLKDDSEKAIEDAVKVAGPQVLTKKFLQGSSQAMLKYGHMMIMISQVTAQPKIDPYAKIIPRSGSFSGGNAAEHWADFIIEYEKSYDSDYILDNPNGKLNDGKSKAIGKKCKIIIQKTTIETSKKLKLEIPIKFGRTPSGIWREYEVVELAIAFGLAKAGGAWISFDENLVNELKSIGLELPATIQGRSKFLNFLEENSVICDFLYNKLLLLVE